MSDTKFTPGPWTINPTGPHWNNPELCNLEINYGSDHECVCDTVYHMADAQLIAAAPDLYEALVALQSAAKQSTAIDREVWLQVHDALKKARGE